MLCNILKYIPFVSFYMFFNSLQNTGSGYARSGKEVQETHPCRFLFIRIPLIPRRQLFQDMGRQRIFPSILKNRESPPNEVISLSTNFMSQSIIRSCSIQTALNYANIHEPTIFKQTSLMAIIGKREDNSLMTSWG